MKTTGITFLSLGLLCVGVLPARPGTAPAKSKSPLAAAGQAPLFALTDMNGRRRSLAEFRGQPVALYFFCGCPWCRDCAQAWSRFQRGGLLSAPANDPAPATIIVFSGDAAEARAFAAQTSLDLKQTTLLLDPSLRVTEQLYHAQPCPRALVLDGQGKTCYSNTHADDAARVAPALTIASRALSALRACEAASNPKHQTLQAVPSRPIISSAARIMKKETAR